MPQAVGQTESAGGAAERLASFFRTLPAETCDKLMSAMLRAEAQGQSFPGSDLVTAQLTRVLADRRRGASHHGSPQRHFFAILEPFLIDEDMPDKRSGRIARASLDKIWLWLRRDVAADEIEAYETRMRSLLAAENIERARLITRDLYRTIVPAIGRNLAACVDEASQRRLVGQLGGQRAFEDMRDMMAALEAREPLRILGERVIGPIRHLDDTQAAFILASLGPFGRNGGALMPHAVAVVMARFTQPWQMLRVATLGAESDESGRIAQSNWAEIINGLVYEVERLAVRAQTARYQNAAERMTLAVADFAHHVRALVSDIDMHPDSPWMRRISVQRSLMAQLLRPELETLPGRVRQTLRPRTSERIRQNAAFDEAEVVSIEAGLELFQVARANAGELALNEVTRRVMADLQAFLDFGVNPLLDGLRGSANEERAFRMKQLDAAVRIAGRILGSSYATLLSKAVDVAAAEKPRPAAKSA